MKSKRERERHRALYMRNGRDANGKPTAVIDKTEWEASVWPGMEQDRTKERGGRSELRRG